MHAWPSTHCTRLKHVARPRVLSCSKEIVCACIANEYQPGVLRFEKKNYQPGARARRFNSVSRPNRRTFPCQLIPGRPSRNCSTSSVIKCRVVGSVDMCPAHPILISIIRLRTPSTCSQHQRLTVRDHHCVIPLLRLSPAHRATSTCVFGRHWLPHLLHGRALRTAQRRVGRCLET